MRRLTVDLPSPHDAPSLRWGVLGPGAIADKLVRSLRHGSQRVTAVASRDLGRARAFADEHGAATAYGSYEELVADPDVDAVYVATPHVLHLEHALLCVEAGKPALVEKPIGLNATQARQVQHAAASAGVLVVEACWNYFLPKYMLIRQVVDDGLLGELTTVSSDHGQRFDDDSRVLQPELGGGPLLDLGSYDFAFATWWLGAPTTVEAVRTDHHSGVHGEVSTVMTHGRGAQSVLNTTVLANTPTAAFVAGTKGFVSIPRSFYLPGPFTLQVEGEEPAEWVEDEVAHEGLHHQTAWFARDLTAGRTTSSIRDLDHSVVAHAAMDAARERTGIVFPGESAPGVLA